MQVGTYNLKTMEIGNPITILSLEDMQRNKKFADKKKSDNEFKVYIRETYGNFYFLFYELLSFNIEKQYIIRFLYLCSHMDYSNSLLFGNAKREDKYMLESDLQEVLNLSERETRNTKNILINKELIKIDSKNRLSVNEVYCLKGKIPINRKASRVRIFEDGFKELYEKSTPKEHKKLALLVQLLPHINLKFNIICKDSACEDIDLVIPMDMKRICEVTECDYNNSTRLKKELLSLRVNRELVVMYNETDIAKFITINPRVYYKGVEKLDVKGLENLFKVNKS